MRNDPLTTDIAPQHPVDPQKKRLRTFFAVAAVICAIGWTCFFLFAWRPVVQDPLEWSAKATIRGSEVVVDITVHNRALWEVSGVQLLEANLGGIAASTPLPVVFGEIAGWRRKTLPVRFPRPELRDGSRVIVDLHMQRRAYNSNPASRLAIPVALP